MAVRHEKVVEDLVGNEDRVTRVREPWSLRKSVYAPRRKRESDAGDFWDGAEIASACALYDWTETCRKSK